ELPRPRARVFPQQQNSSPSRAPMSQILVAPPRNFLVGHPSQIPIHIHFGTPLDCLSRSSPRLWTILQNPLPAHRVHNKFFPAAHPTPSPASFQQNDYWQKPLLRAQANFESANCLLAL